MINKLKTKTHEGRGILEEISPSRNIIQDKSLKVSNSRSILDEIRRSNHYNGTGPGDYNLPSLTGGNKMIDSRN